MLKAGFHEFRRRYISKKGYKDGIHGLIVSLFRAFYHLLIHAKYWEYLNYKDESVETKYKKIEKSIINEHRNKV